MFLPCVFKRDHSPSSCSL